MISATFHLQGETTVPSATQRQILRGAAGFIWALVLWSETAKADLVTSQYSTSGVFSCTYYYIGSCSGGGASITLMNGDAAMTLTYGNVAGVVPIGDGFAHTVDLGTITETLSGTGPFTFPWSNFGHQVFEFDLGLSVLGFGTGTFRAGGFFLGQDLTTLTLTWIYAQASLPGVSPGTGLALAEIDYPYSLIHATSGTTPLHGVISLVPEPSTSTLIGLGLLCLAGVTQLRDRRKRTNAGNRPRAARGNVTSQAAIGCLKTLSRDGDMHGLSPRS